MLINNEISKVNVEQAIELLYSFENDISKVEALTLYQNALLIDEASYSDTSYDDKSVKSFELCLSKLTYNDNGNYFLDASKRYIRLLLKYKQWPDADNFLQLYQNLQSSLDMPVWHINATAKVSFELAPKESFLNPNEIFVLISKAASLPEGYEQAKSVLRDFILRAKHFRETSLLNIQEYQKFVELVKQFISTIDDAQLVEWTNANIPFIDQQDKKVDLGEADNRTVIQGYESKIEEYKNEIEKLTNEIIALYSENEDLHELLKENEELIETTNSSSVINQVPTRRKLKILVLGASTIRPKDIIGIANRYGLSKDNLELKLDYVKNKRFDLNKIRYTSPFSGILIGPIAHKITGLGDHSSILELLKEEGFPPSEAIREKSGELKITKTAISTAFENIITQIGAYDPDVLPSYKLNNN